MNNQTVDQDQLNNCPFNGGYSCLCFSDHGHKKLCEYIVILCVFMTAAAIMRTLIYITDKTRHLCYDPTVAEAEELELEIEASKPDPLSDLSENLNKINICHEALPTGVLLSRQQKKVILYECTEK